LKKINKFNIANNTIKSLGGIKDTEELIKKLNQSIESESRSIENNLSFEKNHNNFQKYINDIKEKSKILQEELKKENPNILKIMIINKYISKNPILSALYSEETKKLDKNVLSDDYLNKFNSQYGFDKLNTELSELDKLLENENRVNNASFVLSSAEYCPPIEPDKSGIENNSDNGAVRL